MPALRARALAAETTLVIGRLDGVWAATFARRDRMIARHTRKIAKAWRSAAAAVDTAQLAADWTQLAGAAVAAADLQAAAAGWVAAIGAAPGYQALQDAIAAAVRAAMAEGEAAALALACAQAGRPVSLEGAWRRAWNALAVLPGLDGLAADWAARMIAGAGTDVARRLAKLARQGADAARLAKAARAVLTRRPRSVWFYSAQAMHTGFAHGALAYYQAEQVPELSWVTAGDDRVCALCETYEADSPWPVWEFPEMPAHGGCRCVPVPAADFVPSQLAGLLAGLLPDLEV